MLWLVHPVAPIPAAPFVRSRALCTARRRQLWLTVARFWPPSGRRLLDANHRRLCHREPLAEDRLETLLAWSARRDGGISSDSGPAYLPAGCAKTRTVLPRNLLSRLRQRLAQLSGWWPAPAHRDRGSRSGHG